VAVLIALNAGTVQRMRSTRTLVANFIFEVANRVLGRAHARLVAPTHAIVQACRLPRIFALAVIVAVLHAHIVDKLCSCWAFANAERPILICNALHLAVLIATNAFVTLPLDPLVCIATDRAAPTARTMSL